MAGESWGVPGKALALGALALTEQSAGSAPYSKSSSLRCSAAKQALIWWRSTPSTTSVPLDIVSQRTVSIPEDGKCMNRPPCRAEQNKVYI